MGRLSSRQRQVASSEAASEGAAGWGGPGFAGQLAGGGGPARLAAGW